MTLFTDWQKIDKMSSISFRRIFFIWWMLYNAVALSSGKNSVKDQFTDSQNPGTVQHFVVDTETNNSYVYVGGTNRLYQLTSELRLIRSIETGPKEDNPNCPPPSDKCECFGSNCKDFDKTLMNSISKGLVIDYRGERLISCTNLFQGHCDKHVLSNISITDPNVWTMLVPNDENSSVVMFVAPGPPNPASTQVLYVAATRSIRGLPAYKDNVPAVCMRSLIELNLVSEDMLTPSRIDIEIQQRDLFRINYVYGFTSLGFSYFLSVQKVSAISDLDRYITQISRICHNDKSFYSYTEIPLECHQDGVHYNILRASYIGYPGTNLAKSLGLPHIAPLTEMEHVLVAVFSNQSHSRTPLSSAAMCIYPMRDVRRKFTETIQRCFNGVGNTGPDHFVQPRACVKAQFEILDDYCGQHDFNHPIKGADPVSQEAVIVWHDTSVTSVAVTVIGDYTVAFVGTEDGSLKKIRIESDKTATEYGSIVIQQNVPIKQDLAFDAQQRHVYAMTDKSVFRVAVQDCSQYSTCSQCLGAGDPYCGWCSLEKRCTLEVSCPNARMPSRWMSYDSGPCSRIIQIMSNQTQKQSNATSLVIMIVQNLPMSVSGKYQCAFSGYGVTRQTLVENYDFKQDPGNNTKQLRCQTPTANLLPPFPTGKDHIVMNLSLMSDGLDFISTNFTFFDCGVHSTCTKCTTSEFPCTWCVAQNKCTKMKEECYSDVLITGRQVPGTSDKRGPESCPRIENEDNSSEILVSSGSEISLRVKVVHLQSFQNTFKCHFNFNGGSEIEKNGRLVADDYIECDPQLFKFNGATHYINVPFSILWVTDTRKALDNPHNIQVRIYKCSEMAYNCGRCRAVDVKHGCGWCSSTPGPSSCSTQEQCRDVGNWLGRDEPCPDPVITKIQPETGPLQGGTNLTISGENLGISIGDTVATVAGIPCKIIGCEASIGFVCETGPSSNAVSGPVMINISKKFEVASQKVFSYVHPRIDRFHPHMGPRSGGTKVTVHGENLNSGTSATALLSNGTFSTNCTFVERTSLHMAVCVTSQSLSAYESKLLTLTIDKTEMLFSRNMFTFVEDPHVDFINPEKSIMSGGSKVVVKGERLNTVSSPSMIIYKDGENATSPCHLVNQSHDTMVCMSPNLHSLGSMLEEPLADEPLVLFYGFVMDGVVSLRNLSSPAMGAHLFSVYPDPKFEEFEGGVKQLYLSKNEYLTINGKNINLALNEGDIRVTISSGECVVTSVSNTQLTCLPLEPDSLPSVADVYVHIGNSTSFRIGTLKYEGSQNILLSLPFMAGIAGAAGLLITIIIIVCIAYRVKSRENDQVVKRMKNQMDVLESRVAKECKEAFAELQTDMTEVTSDITGPGGGIPFRDYRSFCMNVLFPGVIDHPVIRSYEKIDFSSNEVAAKGLWQFNQLMRNKTFLLLFIRTLEQHHDFIVREKVNVASLLSVALQTQMDYHTDILKTLLAELIERAMEGRSHPKLLLRRTESVAEKMLTNWFTFLLYKFLKESAGEPLFMLFRAIKQQIDKGPVDALTSEARYSLSEDKLIRQQVDYRVMTLQVADPDAEYGQEHSVKVLDCDTISQVKEKMLDAIYRNSPFSGRPDKDDLDLEWRTGNKGRVILQDEDLTTKMDADVKRLNTLSHYKVPDGSQMALIQRQNSSIANLALSSERLPAMSKFDSFFSGSLPHSHSLSISHTINMTTQNSAKCYHLVKCHDPDAHREGERGNKMVSEVYLTRLLATKGTLQQFVDDLFETIFSTTNRFCALPLAIKYMFDFFDDQALHHGITDPEVVHTWKSNSLPLRFWVNVVKNPDFVFDVHKSNIVDSCLSVIGQTFMDSCSMSEHKLSKDSPSSKLLYAKDIPKYKKWVERYYDDIKTMPIISDQDMNAMLSEESRAHHDEFNTNAALYELYQYTVRYRDDLMQALEEDEFGRNYRLAERLSQVHRAIDSSHV